VQDFATWFTRAAEVPKALSHFAKLDVCPHRHPVISTFLRFAGIIKAMPYLQTSSNPGRRPERAHFADPTPVVLRFTDGNRSSGKLKVVSVTGGLLAVSRPVAQGLTAKLMFLTSSGSVLGVAQMLTPLSWDQQPFRFVSMHHDDESRLQAAIQSCRERDLKQDKQIKRDREEVDNFRAW